MKSVDLYSLPSGLWTARIYDQTFVGTYEECVAWLRNNGEQV
jgi:hypothetical protein